MQPAPRLAWRFLSVALAVAALAPAQTPVPLTVSPTQLPVGGIGQDYFVFMQATGGNRVNSWSVTAGALPPGLSITVNGILSGRPTESGTFNFTLEARSTQPALGTANLSITVLAITTPSPLADGRGGQPYDQPLSLNVNQLSGVSWSVSGGSLPPGLNLTGSGRISGLPTAPGTYTFTVQASLSGLTASKQFTITITGTAPLVFVTDVFPLAPVNQQFSFQLRASGGIGNYVFSAGSLPSGFTVSPSGLVTGTPTQIGIYDLSFNVTSGTQSITGHTILLGAIDFATQTPLEDAELDVDFGLQFFVTFGRPVWEHIGGAFPPGLSFTPEGTLIGVPTALGTYTFTLRATLTNPAGFTVMQKQFQLTVKPTSPITVSTGALPYGGLNQSYSAVFQASGGAGPYLWTADGLPPGLFMSSTGAITGSPQATGTYAVTVTVAAGARRTTVNTALIVIDIASSSTLPTAQITGAYSFRLATTTGLPSWTLLSGALPPGLGFDASGSITGIPSERGTYTFSARATVPNILRNAPVVTAEREFRISVIGPPLKLVTTSLNTGQVTGAYSQQLAATGGTPPYRFSASGLPLGMRLTGDTVSGTPEVFGTFQTEIAVEDSAAARESRSLSLEITPLGPLSARLRVSPTILRFTIPEGAEASLPQYLSAVSSNGDPVTFTAEAVSATWLELGIASATATPLGMRVRARSEGLKTGSYNGRIRFQSENQLPIEVAVELNVVPAKPVLEASPTLVRFTASTAKPEMMEHLVVLNLSGGGDAVPYQYSLLGSSTWAKAAVSAGAPSTIRGNAPVYLRVTADPRGLAPGRYRDVLRVITSAGTREIPISLFVTAPAPALELSARGVRLATRQGQGVNPSESVAIRNNGPEGSTVYWRAELVRGAGIFELTPATGETRPGQPGVLTVSLKPGLTDVAPQAVAQSALIRISDAANVAAPRYLVAVADIERQFAAAKPWFPRSGLLFQALQNGERPPAQTLRLETASKDPVKFSVSTSALGVDNFLSVAPALGEVSSSQSAELRITAAPGRLSPGLHSGTIHVAIGNELRTIDVRFAIAASADAADKGAARAIASAICKPTRIAAAQTALAGGFSVPAGWPAPVAVRLTDDCGNRVENASAIARFSNGDLPLALDVAGLSATATWQPLGVDPFVTVTVDAAAPGLEPARIEVTGAVTGNILTPPALLTGGLLNNLSGEYSGALAPGTVTQVYGFNLAENTTRAAAAPLPTQALGVETLVGNLAAPTFYWSPRQLTVQLPNELAANQTHDAVVAITRGPDASPILGFTLPEPIDIVPTAAAAYTSGGMLMAYHGNGTVVSAGNPAVPGEELVAYLVGMGETKPRISSGRASPRNPLAAIATEAQVFVDGIPAVVAFEGLAPDQVGLYQINFRVPPGARPGQFGVDIWQNGLAAHSGKLAIGATK